MSIKSKFETIATKLAKLLTNLLNMLEKDVGFDKVVNYGFSTYQLSAFERENFDELMTISAFFLSSDVQKPLETDLKFVLYKEPLDTLFNRSEHIKMLCETGLKKLSLNQINDNLVRELGECVSKERSCKRKINEIYFHFSLKQVDWLRNVSVYLDKVANTGVRSLEDMLCFLHFDLDDQDGREEVTFRKLFRIVKKVSCCHHELAKSEFKVENLITAVDLCKSKNDKRFNNDKFETKKLKDLFNSIQVRKDFRTFQDFIESMKVKEPTESVTDKEVRRVIVVDKIRKKLNSLFSLQKK